MCVCVCVCVAWVCVRQRQRQLQQQQQLRLRASQCSSNSGESTHAREPHVGQVRPCSSSAFGLHRLLIAGHTRTHTHTHTHTHARRQAADVVGHTGGLTELASGNVTAVIPVPAQPNTIAVVTGLVQRTHVTAGVIDSVVDGRHGRDHSAAQRIVLPCGSQHHQRLAVFRPAGHAPPSGPTTCRWTPSSAR
jgi:hypothetical protein